MGDMLGVGDILGEGAGDAVGVAPGEGAGLGAGEPPLTGGGLPVGASPPPDPPQAANDAATDSKIKNLRACSKPTAMMQLPKKASAAVCLLSARLGFAQSAQIGAGSQPAAKRQMTLHDLGGLGAAPAFGRQVRRFYAGFQQVLLGKAHENCAYPFKV
jgi:hypothetical protein